MMQYESWRPVVGYEGLYDVSSRGRIKRVGKGGGATVGRIMTVCVYSGYGLVELQKNHTRKLLRVHRIVAAAFIGPLPTGLEVNHKDFNRLNNSVANLEYVTRSENLRHSYKYNHRSWSRKAIPVIRTNDGAVFHSMDAAGKAMGTYCSIIKLICDGKLGSYKGFKFRYAPQWALVRAA